MPSSVVIPNGPVAEIKIGKRPTSARNAAALLAWADAQLPDDVDDFAKALAVMLAVRRPGLRGKTLTVNLAAPVNLVTVE